MDFMKHQLQGLEVLSRNNRFGIAYEMRLGKTLMMLEHLNRLYKKNFKHKTLVVVPLSGVPVWGQECKKHGYQFRVTELVGSASQRLKRLAEDADLYVINYEGLRILKKTLLTKGFTIFIADESHRLGDMKSQQTQAALEVSRSIPYRYTLTGTPYTNNPESIYSQTCILDSKAFGNYYYFKNNFINYKKRKVKGTFRVKGKIVNEMIIQQPVGFKNIPQLQTILDQYWIRKTQAECLDLPERSYRLISCQLSPEQKKHYMGLKYTLTTLFDDDQFKVTHAGTLIQKLCQVCQGFIYDEEGYKSFESHKVKMLKDLLEDIGSQKIILFCWYTADLEILKRELCHLYNVIVFKGSSEERKMAVEKFQNSEEPQIFLAQTQTACEAIDLSAANHVIYFGQCYSHIIRQQSESRAINVSKKKNVMYYDLVVENTVDDIIYQSCKLKGEMADKVLGDSKRLAELILERGDGNE